MNRPEPDPAVVALARDVERLQREVERLRVDVGRAQETGNSAHRVLVDLADRINAVGESARRPMLPIDTPTGHVESWLAAPRQEALTELVAWIDQILIHYPGVPEALGECWQMHPWIVEELLALRAAWIEAYQGARASGSRAAYWHDRYRPSSLARVAAGTAGCSIDAHQAGGRLHAATQRLQRSAGGPIPPTG